MEKLILEYTDHRTILCNRTNLTKAITFYLESYDELTSADDCFDEISRLEKNSEHLADYDDWELSPEQLADVLPWLIDWLIALAAKITMITDRTNPDWQEEYIKSDDNLGNYSHLFRESFDDSRCIKAIQKLCIKNDLEPLNTEQLEKICKEIYDNIDYDTYTEITAESLYSGTNTYYLNSFDLGEQEDQICKLDCESALQYTESPKFDTLKNSFCDITSAEWYFLQDEILDLYKPTTSDCFYTHNSFDLRAELSLNEESVIELINTTFPLPENDRALIRCITVHHADGTFDVIPGYLNSDESTERLQAVAREHGFMDDRDTYKVEYLPEY